MNCDGRDLHNARLSGTLPALGGCDSLTSLDATNNSFTGLPPGLPASLTHAYLDANPLNATAAELSELTRALPDLHALSVGLISVPIILEDSYFYPDDRCNVDYGSLGDRRGCQGTRVTPPTDAPWAASAAFCCRCTTRTTSRR